jgi:ABC-type nitrate/sulfonate/bicarbonate transport system substrate-binding protein
LVAGRFQHEHRDETVALVAALLEACRMCQDPGFRSDLVSILAMKNYTGASPEVLENSLGSHLETTRFPFNNNSFHLFHGDSVNSPTVEKALWVLAGLRDIGTLPDITCGSLSRIFRQDIYLAATSGGLSA